ncbi:MAG: CotH kinase family protein, partial [Bacteroidaceae bacterium]|nr:CotH kinase family protein [Bacteroidaceae bacterium]
YTIRFTTDGTSPTASSPVYKNSLSLTRTTTIRAFCEGDSMVMRSSITTATYILGETHTLPVVNITVAHADLYDYHRGIYVAGPGANSEYPHYEANYWKSWWKSANVEFFDSIGGGFSAPCELAIFGGFSRTLDKKSFKIRFKDQRGLANLDYDLFNTGTVEELKNFVLRSGSQDYTGVMMRDEFFTSLMRPYCPTLLIQAYRPVALYINGEYFGLYYIREKIDRRFVARHLGVSKDSISIIMSAMYTEEGTKKGYQELISYATSHDLSTPEAYQYIEKRFDFTGLIDYKLGQIYSCNTDLGNVRYAYSPDPSGDQQWRIIYYDLDATWVENKPASTYLDANTKDHVTHQVNILIDRLLKNKTFRQLFLERLSLHLHKTFSPSNATAVFDQLTSTIRPEMRRNCQRWPELSYNTWEKHVAAFRAKFNDRPRTMLSQLRQYLAVTAEENKQYFSDLGY